MRYTLPLVLMLLVAACGPAEQARVAAPASPPLREHAVAPAAWRAVLVAGDSSSPAFDNGVDSMRDRLRGQGVHDISVLAADPAAVSGAQLASAANVERSLAARRGEACFAFMTSHGDKRGFYLRANRGLLGPDLLEQALSRGCDGLPTVLIVSACHSGVFINERTRKSNRVILAAAAPDRTSFGCGADDEFTNYDRCLLQQFDVATTWRQLALGVRACVERSERQLNMRASQPQLFIGADVADLRLPGR